MCKSEGVELFDSEGVKLFNFEGVKLCDFEGVELCDSEEVELCTIKGVEFGKSDGIEVDVIGLEVGAFGGSEHGDPDGPKFGSFVGSIELDVGDFWWTRCWLARLV